MMELHEAIESVNNQNSEFWIGNDIVDVHGDTAEAIATILNAVADGALIPAEQCFEVKEWYEVEAVRPLDDTELKWISVPLSEALHIRAADDVRREALEEAAQLVESYTPAQSNKWIGMKLTTSVYMDESAKSYSQGIRSLVEQGDG